MIRSARGSSLIASIGRSRTPAVAGSYTDISLSSLTRVKVAESAYFVVITDRLKAFLEDRVSIVRLSPGKSDLLENSIAPVLVIEQAALYSGPWIGVGDFVSSALVEELYQAEATARRKGGMVLWLDSGIPESTASRRLISAATGVFQELDLEDPEIDGGRSPLWQLLQKYNHILKGESQ